MSSSNAHAWNSGDLLDNEIIFDPNSVSNELVDEQHRDFKQSISHDTSEIHFFLLTLAPIYISIFRG